MKNKMIVKHSEGEENFKCLYTIEANDCSYYIFTKKEYIDDALVVYASKSKDGKTFYDLTKKEDKLIESILDKMDRNI